MKLFDDMTPAEFGTLGSLAGCLPFFKNLTGNQQRVSTSRNPIVNNGISISLYNLFL